MVDVNVRLVISCKEENGIRLPIDKIKGVVYFENLTIVVGGKTTASKRINIL